MSNTLERVTSITVEHLDIDEAKVTADSRFVEDLGADSLDMVEMIMDVEEEFGIEIPDEDAESLETVGELVTYVNAHERPV